MSKPIISYSSSPQTWCDSKTQPYMIITNCSSASILPYLSQYNYKNSSKTKWLETITWKTKGKAKERSKDSTTKDGKQNWRPKNGQKTHNQRRGRASPSHGRKPDERKPIASLMLSACKSWNLIVIGGREQASPTDAIFLSIAKTKVSMLKSNINTLSEKLNAKRQR